MRIITLTLLLITLCTQSLYSQQSNNYLMYTPESDKYTILIKEIILKSKLLDLEEKEKGYIEYLERFYLKILNEKTKDFKKNSTRITETINSKNRSLKDARKSVRKNAQLYLEIGYTFIESLDYLKKNLGRTKFDKLFYSDELSLFIEKDEDLGRKSNNADESDDQYDFEQTGIEEEGEIEE